LRRNASPRSGGCRRPPPEGPRPQGPRGLPLPPDCMFHGIKTIRSFPEFYARLLVFRGGRGYMGNSRRAQTNVSMRASARFVWDRISCPELNAPTGDLGQDILSRIVGATEWPRSVATTCSPCLRA